MGRRKKPDVFRSVFTIKVVDTHFYDKDSGLNYLANHDSIAGIGFSEKRFIKPDMFVISSRSNRLEYAIKDYNFLKRVLKSQFGILENISIEGRFYERKKAYYRPLNFEYEFSELKELFK